MLAAVVSPTKRVHATAHGSIVGFESHEATGRHNGDTTQRRGVRVSPTAEGRSSNEHG